VTPAPHKPFGPYERFFKRLLDIVFAACLLLILSPLMLGISLLVRWKLGSPVLFGQPRPGKNERPFLLRKFRSMSDARDGNGNLLPDDLRLSRFGKFLRSTSLDELPELFNILRGDMSFVGPRPLLMEYLPFYTDEERHRHDVRPGLTGLAQINGRNAIASWEERFRYDLEYVGHVSLGMDLKIAFLTVFRVLKRSGIQVGSEIKAGRLDVARRECFDQKI
jgi:lipopolysaccharide/colanic/teichoic acid biosynthesis glycosyltransferase